MEIKTHNVEIVVKILFRSLLRTRAQDSLSVALRNCSKVRITKGFKKKKTRKASLYTDLLESHPIKHVLSPHDREFGPAFTPEFFQSSFVFWVRILEIIKMYTVKEFI